ncbi:MAG: 2'-5' RNA ligase [Deltaproteobacteria bacterium RIFOXYD12_FULL_50_9]|nr:MAG: 2'-5' RNA ligase [Deltaproteobacteria bacterium RIFOXYD12_FULL_50_9]
MNTRLFIAIDLPEEIKKELSGLSFGIPGARWVPADQLHLTLRFIGEVDGFMFQKIRDLLELIPADPFDFRLREFGCFPPRKEPRVLWIGVEPKDQLIALRNRIETALLRNGLEPEGRKYTPHITIARLQGTPISRLTNFMAGNNLYSSPIFRVEAFQLYSSTLSAKGAIHKVEASYQFN